jgi:hypothetical protein
VKSQSIIFLIVILSLSCSEAPKIEIEVTPRVVLAELFTFARCTYCPFSEHALDSLSKDYGDSLAIIAYHRRLLGDTLSPDYVAVRESLYQIQVSPTVVFDGLHAIQTEDPNQNYSVYNSWIIHRRNEAPKLRLHLETNLAVSTVNIKVHIIVHDSLEESNYQLFTVLYEDSVDFVQIGAPDSIYCYVMRKIIPDAHGTSIDLFYPDSQVWETDIQLEDYWDEEELGIVSFVQDLETHEVLQAVVDKRIGAD